MYNIRLSNLISAFISRLSDTLQGIDIKPLNAFESHDTFAQSAMLQGHKDRMNKIQLKCKVFLTVSYNTLKPNMAINLIM